MNAAAPQYSPSSPFEFEWVRPPRQARSQQTFERILDAAEQLVLQRGADATSVSAIAKAAGSSVGAFYARFKDKEGLLRVLFERFYAEAGATIDSILDADRWQGVETRDMVRGAIRFMIDVFRERRYLIAAFSVRAARDESLKSLSEGMGMHIARKFAELLEARGETLRSHDDPVQAIAFTTWLVMSALEARTVYASAQPSFMEADRLMPEIVSMCLGYLGLEEKPMTSVPSPA